MTELPADDFEFRQEPADAAEMSRRRQRACGMVSAGVCFVRDTPRLSCAGRCLVNEDRLAESSCVLTVDDLGVVATAVEVQLAEEDLAGVALDVRPLPDFPEAFLAR